MKLDSDNKNVKKIGFSLSLFQIEFVIDNKIKNTIIIEINGASATDA